MAHDVPILQLNKSHFPVNNVSQNVMVCLVAYMTVHTFSGIQPLIYTGEIFPKWQISRNTTLWKLFHVTTLKLCSVGCCFLHIYLIWGPFQYQIRRLIVRSREVSKPRDRQFELSHRIETWQAHRQQCCRRALQISGQSDNSEHKSRGIESSWDLAIRRLIGYGNGVLLPIFVMAASMALG